MLHSFLELLYPRTCLICETMLLSAEDQLCLHCWQALPRNKFHLDAQNPLMKLLWGRVDAHRAMARFNFKKGSNVQKMLHFIKYKNGSKLAYEIGLEYGYALKPLRDLHTLSGIVPVPLHPKKLQKRGYNQSEAFAQGMAVGLKLPVLTDLLMCVVEGVSQTKHNRFARWQNVSERYEISESYVAEPAAHYLLVDDVVTTGATLEACALRLKEMPDCTISVAAIAFADKNT